MACDDGDYNVPSFDFDGLTINNCGNTVFNKITSSGTESLILQIDADNTEDLLFKTALDSVLIRIEPDSDNTMYYRIFNGSITSGYFCQEIPASTPDVTEEWFGEGDLYLSNTITLDDNDGVPAEFEDINGNGDLTDDDTDGDGYPNYIDIDDDGDGILTIDEDYDISSGQMLRTGNPQTSNTDGDEFPNYLDIDDDNDGVLSKIESDTEDQNNNGIVNYLDDLDTEEISERTFTNFYTYYYSMRFEFSSLTLFNDSSTINYQDGYNYGTKSGSFETSENPENSSSEE